MDWNPVHTGRFLSGDVEGGVCLWEPCEGGWDVSEIMRSPVSRGGKKSTSSSSRNKPQSFSSSSSSLCRFEGVTPGSTVEETQWKIKGSGAGDVFATASSDGGIRIYDCRSSSRAPCLALLHAHASDVNALRWSPVHGDLLLSGDEDGCAKVWDERFGESPLVVMHWHKKPITSLDWHPTDEATFATSSLDNSIALWDMSVEIDQDETPAEQEDPAQKKKNAKGEEDDPKSKLPEQLMFLHLGQDHISELKFHPLIPGVVISTACDGFNFFKTCNI
ncbi:wd g-beta repeat-containing protein [Cystoisospora suis]|uniref:Wd g-beta repeat-containing protein n=1 Tax=Cystoisospora suis TaxID=483139 RepID=A0A2C6L0M7_9APIC|nr:wd g-beta repeat-containing protein [Cystoisospora suis]